MKKLDVADKLMLTATDLLGETQCDFFPPAFPKEKNKKNLFLDWISNSPYVVPADPNSLESTKEFFQKLTNHYKHLAKSARESYNWANSALLVLDQIGNPDWEEQRNEANDLVIRTVQLLQLVDDFFHKSKLALERIESAVKERERFKNVKNLQE